MDFIERLFGVSPDGGDGSLEILYILALLIALAIVFFGPRFYRLMERKHPD